jgi:hypothetical protein
MAELVGTAYPLPKNQLSIYNPDEFIPLDTTTTLINDLVVSIETNNANQQSQLSANEAKYNDFFTNNPILTTITPTFLNNANPNTTYTVASFPTVLNRVYVCQLQGVLETGAINNTFGLWIQGIDATTTAVQFRQFCYANYNASQPDEPFTLTINRNFIITGTGNTMNIQIQAIFTISTVAQVALLFPPVNLFPAGNFGITTPLLTVMAL